MPCWYWDKKDLDNSPSRKQGVTPENENRYRREGSRFIYKLGQGMKLHHDTLASAAVFYHRFYQIHSFYKFRSRYVTATCCLFLAGKVEETPKKWTDLIRGAKQILAPQQFAQFGSMEDAKDELMAMERVLLQTIKFDFNIEHAHKFIIQYCEELRADVLSVLHEDKVKEMVQQSWNFANDSYYTNLCLQWEPQIIAICMIYLSGKIQKIEALGYKTVWWEKFIPDLERDLIESVCHQVLDIYSKPSNKKSATPKPGPTPAKKPKLESQSSNPGTPQGQAAKQLQSLLSNFSQDKIKSVMESSTKNTPVRTASSQSSQSFENKDRYHTPQPQRAKQLNQNEWSTPQPNYKTQSTSHQGTSGSFGNGGGSDNYHNNPPRQNNQWNNQHYHQGANQQQGWPGEKSNYNHNYNRSYQRGNNRNNRW